MSDLTMFILMVFFGVFSLDATFHFYIKKGNMSWFYATTWFISTIIFAIICGSMFG